MDKNGLPLPPLKTILQAEHPGTLVLNHGDVEENSCEFGILSHWICDFV